MSRIAEALAALGHTLPPLKVPAANYLSYTLHGELLTISGQVGQPGAARGGAVGKGLDVLAARADAQRAALGVLAAIDAALDGDAGRIVQVLRLGVYIAAAPDFEAHGLVANGASDLLVAALGERGRHARTAIGVLSLPGGAAVEVDAVVRVRDGAGA
ncbi:RidA family protein [Janthinobacterium sp.]|uniref:RidA family protein n=1 Tax=Janthinobacterium sp. TaxID=1871054 RepID=UPI00293D70F3|nr:RidA family protein [Janthinobacterium sp.]